MQQIKKVVLCCLICLICLNRIPGQTAEASIKGTINTQDTNLRKKPTTTSDVVCTIPGGKYVTIKGKDDNWYIIEYEGQSGYVRSDKIDLGNNGKVYAKREINIRKQASTDSSILCTIVKGQALKVQSYEGEWYKVKLDDMTGYVRSDVVQLDKVSVSASSSSSVNDTSKTSIETANTTSGSNSVSSSDTVTDEAAESQADETSAVDDMVQIGDSGTNLGVEEAHETDDESGETSDAEDDQPEQLGVREVQQLLQQLNFYSGDIDGKIGKNTLAALKAFQRAYDLTIDGEAGSQTLAALQEAARTGGNGSSAACVKVSQNGVILAEWFNYMKANLPKYEALRVVDVDTGDEFKLRAFSLGNHADVETYTQEDTNILYKINGNKWTWTPRAIWVYFDGKIYAAAINVMPHGGETISDNGMNGQICMHFLHSRQHNTGQENKDLQAAVLKAFNQAENAPPA